MARSYGGAGRNSARRPDGLAAAAGDAQVGLTWSANGESDLAGYNVYRATSQGGPYTQQNGSLLTNASYNDSGLTNGTTYYYIVTAVDTSSNESGSSIEASATPIAPGGGGGGDHFPRCCDPADAADNAARHCLPRNIR